jgi:hypothetical protein
MDVVKIRVGEGVESFDCLMSNRQYSKSSLPGGIHLGIGTAAMIVVAFAAAAFTNHGTVQRLLVMALAVGVGAGLIRDWRYSAGLGLIGYLLYVGFLVNGYGELTWDGQRTARDVVVFSLAYALGLAQRWMRGESKVRHDDPDASEAELTSSSSWPSRTA